jgi:hypothetical protein
MIMIPSLRRRRDERRRRRAARRNMQQHDQYKMSDVEADLLAAALSRLTQVPAILPGPTTISSEPKRLDRAGSVAIITGISVVIVACVNGAFTLFRPALSQAPSVVVNNCYEQQQGVIQRLKENPGLKLQYSGPSEQQCHLNELVSQLTKS